MPWCILQRFGPGELALIDTLREVTDNRGVGVGEVSTNWVLAQSGVTTALLGSTNPKNVARNVAAA